MTNPNASAAWLDSAVAVQEQRVSAETPGIYEMLQVISVQLSGMTEVAQAILAALGSSSDSRSSVEVKTSTRGVDVSSKCYAQSSMDGLSERAVAEYFATLEHVQRRLNGEAV